ncbi:acyltransferase [Candidatus Parcubacteria bacterium]|nr:MAG: acyltransferase [Candidatus Parcubacteria bacterium]
MKQQGLFGTYRYALALLVVLAHTGGPELAPWAGTYAVFAFYTLSGYLMTFVLREVYGTDAVGGIRRFAVNRFLRVFPLYWVVLVITLAVLSMDIEWGAYRDPAIRMPEDLPHWLVNLTILGLARGITEFHMSGWRLVMTAWSLHVELSFYFLMALFFVRRNAIIYFWFLFSLFYTLWILIDGWSWQEHYFPLAAASLPFALGSLIYLARKSNKSLHWIVGVFCSVLFVAHALFSLRIYGDHAQPMQGGFYVSLMLAVLSVWGLGALARDSGSKISAIDVKLGDLSYPLFLVHPITGMILSASLDLGKGFALFLVTAVAGSFMSWLLHELVEAKVERVRALVRGKALP